MFRSLLLFSLLASPAMAFQARNGVSVIGNADQIMVQASPGQAAPQSWCAAGDYVIRALGLGPATPVYRISPPPRRAGEGVVFSLSPEGAAERNGLLQIGATGLAVSAGHAQALCQVGRWRY